MVLPAIQDIQRRYPDAVLYAVTSDDGLRLLPLVGIEAQRICVYRNKWQTMHVKQWLSQHCFDHVFCFESKKRTVNGLPKDAHVLKPVAQMQSYANRCRTLVSPDETFVFPKEGTAYLSVLLETQQALADMLHHYGIGPKTVLIGLHPTYSGYGKWRYRKEHRHRMWPVDHFANLALQLSDYAEQQAIDLKVVINVLPKEQAIGQSLIEQSNGRVIALPEIVGFQSYLAYLHRLNVMVVANTGVMHLSAALNTPLVALFSAHNPDDCGPYMAKERCVVLRAEQMPHPELGLEAIEVAPVFQSIVTLLKSETVHD